MQTGPLTQTPAKPARSSRRLLRGLAWTLGLLFVLMLVLLALAWALFPTWAPSLAQQLLPAGTRLVELQASRPGFSRLQVQRLVLDSPLGGQLLEITVADLELEYAGPQLRLGDLDLRFTPASAAEPGTETDGLLDPWQLETYAVPRLLLPTRIPVLLIDRLRVAVDEPDTATAGGATEILALEQVRLEPGMAALLMEAELPSLPGFTGPARLQLSLADDLLSAELQLADSDPQGGAGAPLLSFRQAQNGERLDASLQLTLELARLDLATLATRVPSLLESPVFENWPASLDPAALRTSGQLLLNVAWSGERAGTAPLLPTAASARFSEVQLGAAQDQLTLALALEAHVEGELLNFSLDGLALEASLGSPALLGALASSLTGQGIEGLVNAEQPASIHIAVAAPIAGQLQLSGSQSQQTSLRGEPVLHFAQMDGLALELSLDGAQWQSGSRDNSQMTQASSAFRLDLSSPRAFSARLGEGSLQAASLDAAFEGHLDWQAASAAGAGDNTSLRFSGPLKLTQVNLPDMGISMAALALEIGALDLLSGNGELELLTTGLQIAATEPPMTGVDLDLKGHLEALRHYKGTGELLLGVSAELPFRFAADLEAGTVGADFDGASLPASAIPSALKPLAIALPKELAFRDGLIRLDGHVDLVATQDSATLGGAVEVTGENLVLAFGESRIEGLSFDTQLDLAEAISGRGGVALKLMRMAAGLDLTEFSAGVELPAAGGFALPGLKAQFLGGTLESPGLRVSPDGLEDTVISLRSFDLGQAFAVVDVSGLEGTGRMDAELPIRISPEGPTIQNGRIRALEPGRLAYSSGVPASNIGLQALENFRYDTLEGALDYAANGDYTLALDLLGRNPDLYGGYPIRFRLTLGGSMPALFRSLLVTGDFERAILEQARTSKPTSTPDTSPDSGPDSGDVQP